MLRLESGKDGLGCTGNEGPCDGEELGDCDADCGLLVEVNASSKAVSWTWNRHCGAG